MNRRRTGTGLLLWVGLGMASACGGGQSAAVGHKDKRATADSSQGAVLPPANPLVEEGESLLAQGKVTEASEVFRRALVGNPQDARAHFDRGLIAEHEGRNPDAMREYQTAISHEPRFAQPMSNLALLYRDQGHLDRAHALLLKVVDLSPKDGEAWLNLALTLEDQGKIPAAKMRYRTAIKLLPHDPVPRVNLGLLLLDAKEYGEARTLLREAMPLSTGDRAMLFAVGSGLRRAKDPASALRAMRAAVIADSTEPPPSVVAELALAELAMGERHQAISTLRGLIRSRPKYALAHYLLGNMLAAEQQYAEAVLNYQRYLTLDPQGAEAANAKRRMAMAKRASKRP
ncbi:MAG: tetratricopeptide repeat protein [Myxococcales bacterium]|nr:tetratricopeptide repeat protein [Myxococcales bacterium]